MKKLGFQIARSVIQIVEVFFRTVVFVLALRVFLAVIRLTINRQCEVGGGVIGPAGGSQDFCDLGVSFLVITFFPDYRFQ